jgi:putative ABC transport system ATP-binding protein
MSGLILEIRNMRKRLVSGDSVFTLEVPAFALDVGKFYGLVGRSGSGKSTMLDIIALVSRPTNVESFLLSVSDKDNKTYDLSAFSEENEGVVSRNAEKLTAFLRTNYFGYVLQSGGLFPFLTVQENIELPFRVSGRPFSPSAIVTMAKRLDLADQLHKKPAALSGGQRQRASILRALATRPRILLADEPTAAVDEAMAEVILTALRELASEQQTCVVLVSHDMELVRTFSDHIVHLVPQRAANGHVTSVCSLTAAA